MSETRAACELNARVLIDDLDHSAYGVTSERLHEIVKHEAQRIGRAVGLGSSWSSAFVTLTAGDRDYPLNTGNQYANIEHLIVDSLNWPMSKIPLEAMNAYYMGFVPFSNARGIPRVYSIWEDSSQVVHLRIFPTPATNDSLTAFYKLQVTPLALDADAIPFSDDLLRALEKSVAVRMWQSMPMDKRKVGKEFVESLAGDVAEGIAQERIRLNRLKRTSVVTLTEA